MADVLQLLLLLLVLLNYGVIRSWLYPLVVHLSG